MFIMKAWKHLKCLWFPGFCQWTLPGFCIWILPGASQFSVYPSCICNSVSRVRDCRPKYFSKIVNAGTPSVPSIPPYYLKVNFHERSCHCSKKIYNSYAILTQHSYPRVSGERFCSSREKLPPSVLKTSSTYETWRNYLTPPFY